MTLLVSINNTWCSVSPSSVKVLFNWKENKSIKDRSMYSKRILSDILLRIMNVQILPTLQQKYSGTNTFFLCKKFLKSQNLYTFINANRYDKIFQWSFSFFGKRIISECDIYYTRDFFLLKKPIKIHHSQRSVTYTVFCDSLKLRNIS